MSEINSGHDPLCVASYLVHQGIAKKSPYTPLQVIKLTYLCHGWMLGLYARPISERPVEAWRYGPVIPIVYHNVKMHGRHPIERGLGFGWPNFDNYEENLIEQVLDVYADFSGIDLSAITHQEGTPWHQVWSERGKNAIIPDKLIQQHYAELAKA